MPYYFRCMLCNFLSAADDINKIKYKVWLHLTKSHKFEFELPSEVKLRDLEDVIRIMRLSRREYEMLLKWMGLPEFWKNQKRRL